MQEERDHGLTMLNYLRMRGHNDLKVINGDMVGFFFFDGIGDVVTTFSIPFFLRDRQAPKDGRYEWETPLAALRQALDMEKQVTQFIKEIIDECADAEDHHVLDFRTLFPILFAINEDLKWCDVCSWPIIWPASSWRNNCRASANWPATSTRWVSWWARRRAPNNCWPRTCTIRNCNRKNVGIDSTNNMPFPIAPFTFHGKISKKLRAHTSHPPLTPKNKFLQRVPMEFF